MKHHKENKMSEITKTYKYAAITAVATIAVSTALGLIGIAIGL